MGNSVGYNSPLHRLIERFGEVGLPVRDPPRFNLPPRDETNPIGLAPVAEASGAGP